MNDNIDKNEIRKAIDRLQAEHPCGIAYDPATFVNMEAVNTIKECVDKIARRMMEDTEINIICEFAKLYLDGVRPVVMPKQEWIPCGEQLPKEDDTAQVLVSVNERYAFYPIILMPSNSVKTEYKLGHIDAWMPLPEPYMREGEQE